MVTLRRIKKVISVFKQAQSSKQLEFTERDMKIDNNITNGNLHEMWWKMKTNIIKALNLTIELDTTKTKSRVNYIENITTNKGISHFNHVWKDGRDQSLEVLADHLLTRCTILASNEYLSRHNSIDVIDGVVGRNKRTYQQSQSVTNRNGRENKRSIMTMKI